MSMRDVWQRSYRVMVIGMVVVGGCVLMGGCKEDEQKPYARQRSAADLARQQGIQPGEETVVDLGGGVKLMLAWCPAGTFDMGTQSGDEDIGPNECLQVVTLTSGFWIGKVEVTRGQWERVMNLPASSEREINRPMSMVSWKECQKFIRRLNAQVSGGEFRLPTEAEWEYACRAGTNGVTDGALGEMEWHAENSGGMLHPVGLKQPNAWKIHDMRGNAAEWVWDGHHLRSPGAVVTNPVNVGPPPNTGRMICGGSWCMPAKNCRPSVRTCNSINDRFAWVGFRVVRESQ